METIFRGYPQALYAAQLQMMAQMQAALQMQAVMPQSLEASVQSEITPSAASVGKPEETLQTPMEEAQPEAPLPVEAQSQPLEAAAPTVKGQAETKPYMIYRREDQAAPFGWPGKRQRRKIEADYFKGLYPLAARRHQTLVEEAVDRMDYPGSPMYDEYPDREALYRLRGQIVNRAGELGLPGDQDLSLLLLVNELYRRRAVNYD